MPSADGIIIFDPLVSDIPEAEFAGLTWDEMRTITLMRYREAGEPHDKLRGWLDDHKVKDRSVRVADLNGRIMLLDWMGMGSLMRQARFWVLDARDEQFPPGQDGEFE